MQLLTFSYYQDTNNGIGRSIGGATTSPLTVQSWNYASAKMHVNVVAIQRTVCYGSQRLRGTNVHNSQITTTRCVNLSISIRSWARNGGAKRQVYEKLANISERPPFTFAYKQPEETSSRLKAHYMHERCPHAHESVSEYLSSDVNTVT